MAKGDVCKSVDNSFERHNPLEMRESEFDPFGPTFAMSRKAAQLNHLIPIQVSGAPKLK